MLLLTREPYARHVARAQDLAESQTNGAAQGGLLFHGKQVNLFSETRAPAPSHEGAGVAQVWTDIVYRQTHGRRSNPAAGRGDASGNDRLRIARGGSGIERQ